MKVVILRGLPGSGKSTWIRTLTGKSYYEVFSADSFHMVGNEYRFDPKRVSYAHNECFKGYVSCLMVEKKTEYVIVDNTNTSLVELAPYVRVAEAFGIPYEIKYFFCDPIASMRRNVHQVPPNTILKMYDNLTREIVPPYWNQTVVY